MDEQDRQISPKLLDKVNSFVAVHCEDEGIGFKFGVGEVIDTQKSHFTNVFKLNVHWFEVYGPLYMFNDNRKPL